eukprot:594700_1
MIATHQTVQHQNQHRTQHQNLHQNQHQNQHPIQLPSQLPNRLQNQPQNRLQNRHPNRHLNQHPSQPQSQHPFRLPKPTAQPTTTPTTNPTPIPTPEPTPKPTAQPTTTPTTNPTPIPTPEPTPKPTAQPTTTPTTNPTRYPTIDPTAHPTIAPSAIPTVDPTIAPTLYPTVTPTISPTSDPTLDPTVDPTIHPTIDLTIDPTDNPTMEPTSDPTDDPTKDPTTHSPTNDPTLDPTADPTHDPTTEPTINPTTNPTKYPTLHPSVAPTPICHSAKYKGTMISSPKQNINDFLWGGDSLVSRNCKFLLTMKKNGNLTMYGLLGAKHNMGDWKKVWSTNTRIYNYSQESVPQLLLMDGALRVMEHAYKNVPGIEPIQLWNSKDTSNVQSNTDNLILTLSDTACLILNGSDPQTNKRGALWMVCPFEDTMIRTTEIMVYTTDEGDLYTSEKQNKHVQQWIIMSLVILISTALVAMMILYIFQSGCKCCRNRDVFATAPGLSPETPSGHSADRITTLHISRWMFETAEGREDSSDVEFQPLQT